MPTDKPDDLYLTLVVAIIFVQSSVFIYHSWAHLNEVLRQFNGEIRRICEEASLDYGQFRIRTKTNAFRTVPIRVGNAVGTNRELIEEIRAIRMRFRKEAHRSFKVSVAWMVLLDFLVVVIAIILRFTLFRQ